jgi:hypothetical protein
MLPKINSIFITVILLMQLLLIYVIMKQHEQVIHLVEINKSLRYTLDMEMGQIKNLFYVGNYNE